MVSAGRPHPGTTPPAGTSWALSPRQRLAFLMSNLHPLLRGLQKLGDRGPLWVAELGPPPTKSSPGLLLLCPSMNDRQPHPAAPPPPAGWASVHTGGQGQSLAIIDQPCPSWLIITSQDHILVAKLLVPTLRARLLGVPPYRAPWSHRCPQVTGDRPFVTAQVAGVVWREG